MAPVSEIALQICSGVELKFCITNVTSGLESRKERDLWSSIAIAIAIMLSRGVNGKGANSGHEEAMSYYAPW